MPPPLDEPTMAEPGSLEKIAVMIRRYAEGKAILHPLDNLFHTTPKENNCVRLLIGGVRETRNRGSRRSRAKHFRGYCRA